MMDEGVQTEDVEESVSETLLALARGSIATASQQTLTPLNTQDMISGLLPQTIVSAAEQSPQFETPTTFTQPPASPRLEPQPSEMLAQVSPLLPRNVGLHGLSAGPASSVEVTDVIDDTVFNTPALIDAQLQPIVHSGIHEASPFHNTHVSQQVIANAPIDASFPQSLPYEPHVEDQYGSWQRVNAQFAPLAEYAYNEDSRDAPEHNLRGQLEDQFREQDDRLANLPVDSTHQYPDPEEGLSFGRIRSPWQSQAIPIAYPDLAEDGGHHEDNLGTLMQTLHDEQPQPISRSESRQSAVIDLADSDDEERRLASHASPRPQSVRGVAQEYSKEVGGYEDEVEEDAESNMDEDDDRQHYIEQEGSEQYEVDSDGVPLPYSDVEVDEVEEDDMVDESFDEEAVSLDEQGNRKPPGFRSINRSYGDSAHNSRATLEENDEVSDDYDELEESEDNYDHEQQTVAAQPKEAVMISLLSDSEEGDVPGAPDAGVEEEPQHVQLPQHAIQEQSADEDDAEELSSMAASQHQDVLSSPMVRDVSEVLSDGEMADDEEPGNNFRQDALSGDEAELRDIPPQDFLSSPGLAEDDKSGSSSDMEVDDAKAVSVHLHVQEVPAVENMDVDMDEKTKKIYDLLEDTSVHTQNPPPFGFDGTFDASEPVQAVQRSSPPASIFSNIARIGQAMAVKSSPPRSTLFSKMFGIDGANEEPERHIAYPKLPLTSSPRTTERSQDDSKHNGAEVIIGQNQLPTPVDTQVRDEVDTQEDYHVMKLLRDVPAVHPNGVDQGVEKSAHGQDAISRLQDMDESGLTVNELDRPSRNPLPEPREIIAFDGTHDSLQQEREEKRIATPEVEDPVVEIPKISPRRSHRRVRSTSKALAMQEALSAVSRRDSFIDRVKSKSGLETAQSQQNEAQKSPEPLITRSSLRSASPGLQLQQDIVHATQVSDNDVADSRRNVEPSITKASLRFASPTAVIRKENVPPATSATPAKPKHAKKTSIDQVPPSPAIILDKPASPKGHDASIELAIASLHSPEHDLRRAPILDLRLRLIQNLRTELEAFKSLKVLRYELGRKLDVLAIATSVPAPPERAKNGPRHYLITFNVTDPSIAPTGVTQVQILRPYKDALPTVNVGDGILLRNFAVLALKNKGFGLRSDSESGSWAVFKKGEEVEVKGPPVEFDDAEKNHITQMKVWHENLDESSVAKLKRANGEKATT